MQPPSRPRSPYRPGVPGPPPGRAYLVTGRWLGAGHAYLTAAAAAAPSPTERLRESSDRLESACSTTWGRRWAPPWAWPWPGRWISRPGLSRRDGGRPGGRPHGPGPPSGALARVAGGRPSGGTGPPGARAADPPASGWRWPPGAYGLDDAGPVRARPRGSRPMTPCSGDGRGQLAGTVASSGTTGAPKVIRPDRGPAAAHGRRPSPRTTGSPSAEPGVQPACPCSTSTPRWSACWPPWWPGSRSCWTTASTGTGFWDAMDAHRVTWINAVPAILVPPVGPGADEAVPPASASPARPPPRCPR